jgi:two-component system OmpR family response regulator
MSDSQAAKTAVIIEDDPDIRHLLVEVLEAGGFSTVSVGNGIDGVTAVQNYQPLITTLDVNMPGIDGFEAARRIRATSDTYIIMLTGLEDETDVVLGLGAGADEYLTKPFRPRELRARIEAMLRRPRASGGPAAASAPRQEQSGPSFPTARTMISPQPNGNGTQPGAGYGQGAAGAGYAPQNGSAPQGYAGQPTEMPPLDDAPPTAAFPEPIVVSSSALVAAASGSSTELVSTNGALGPHTLTHRDLQVDPESRIVQIRGQNLELTRTEFDLLAALMESKRRVRSKADLTLVLRGESYVTSYFVGEADKRAIEAHMTNLRRKLGDNPANPRYIETVRGVGYRMTAEAVAG